jgi:RHS repeat-associated protein
VHAITTELAAADGTSAVTTTYTARGTVGLASSSYGALVTSVVRDAMGNISSIHYGDVASTTTSFTFDSKLRIASVQTTRGAPSLWTRSSPGYSPAPPSPPSTLETTLENLAFGYDEVGNATTIQDLRDPTAWPVGAKPASLAIQYDDLYRVTNVAYQYAGSGDAWTNPFDAEDRKVHPDSRRGAPAPRVSFPSRLVSQTFAYDSFGSATASDDDEHGFFDRSLGTVTNGASVGKPYQLLSATNESLSSSSQGHLTAAYDDGGYMTGLTVVRRGACLPAGASCGQRFAYEWDEAGYVARARRWDVAGDPGSPTAAPPSTAPAAELQFAYDSNGARTRKTALDATGNQRHALYPFAALEIRGARFDGEEFERTAATEVPYLYAHGVRLARVEYALESVPTQSSGARHVYMELPDFVGSTSFVIDHDTSELVEHSTYTAYGSIESDYRPERWASFREDHGFTGKESDVEVGLVYFGQRYYSPALARWISPDPLALHAPSRGDPNLYAYVHGRVLRATDPTGLDEACQCSSSNDVTSHLPAFKEVESQRATPASGVVDLNPEVTRIANEFELAASKRRPPRDMFDFVGDVSDIVDATIDEAGRGKTAIDRGIGYGLVLVPVAMYGVAGVLQPLHAIDNVRHAADEAEHGEKGAAIASVGWALFDIGTSEAKEFLAPLQVARFGAEGRIVYGALDHLQRPTGVVAKIELDMIGKGTPAAQSIIPPGWLGNGRLFNQARGHLLGAQLGGSGSVAENLVAIQHLPVNTPYMRDYENAVRTAVEGGETVMYSSVPVYKGDSLVPRGITITASGSGGFSLTRISPLRGGIEGAPSARA